MRKFALVVFPDETDAFRGYHALDVLHRDGSLHVHGAAVVERDEDGALSVRKRTGDVPLGGGFDALVRGAPSDLLELVVRQLAPGTVAMIAELSEDSDAPIEARMELLGGTAVCEWWREVGDDAPGPWTRREAEHDASRAEPHVAVRMSGRRG